MLCAQGFPCSAHGQKSDPGSGSGRDDCYSTGKTLILAVIKSKPSFPRVLKRKLVNQVFVIINSQAYTKISPKAPGTGVSWDLDTYRMLLSLANMHRLAAWITGPCSELHIHGMQMLSYLQTPTAAISTRYHGREPQRWNNVLWGAAGRCKICMC